MFFLACLGVISTRAESVVGFDTGTTVPQEICDLGLSQFSTDCDDNYFIVCDCCTDCGDYVAPLKVRPLAVLPYQFQFQVLHLCILCAPSVLAKE